MAGVALVLALVIRHAHIKSRWSSTGPLAPLGSEVPTISAPGEVAPSTNTHQGKPRKENNQLKSRFVALSILVATIFGSLAAKLWSIQVLNYSTYSAQSESNRLATLKTVAARGRIFDAEGIVLVDNKTVATAMADADVADDRNVCMRLSTLLGIPYTIIRQRIQDSSSGAQARRKVASDLKDRDVAFIVEHPDSFPGITIEETANRVYPYGALAGAVLGYTGTVTDYQLENKAEGMDYSSGDEIGQSGVELAYNSVLFGAQGERVVVTDADGLVHEVVSETKPTQGNDVYLSISARVQGLAEQRLQELIAPNNIIGEGTGTSGAIVAMEVDTGRIVCMASFPSFDPSTFVGGISQEAWDRYNDTEHYNPLLNRCISGMYPAASTFKSAVALAGLEYGMCSTSTDFNCTGEWTGFGEDYPQMCWQTEGHGHINLRDGIVLSCDVVFYEIAKSFYYSSASVGETALQDYVRKFGYGSLTGIELQGEAAGVVPTPEWKAETWKNAPEEGQWQAGDMSNMSIGQGNVLVTPLQTAVAYASYATGKKVTPTLLKQVRNSNGEVVVESTPKVEELQDVPQANLDFLREALHGVALEDGNVPNLFARYGIDGACKTGTGEWADHDGYSWFATYAPFDQPKYVVSTVIVEGGFGAGVAGPIAVEVLDACLKFGEGTLDISVPVTKEIDGSVEYQGTGAGRME